MSAFWLRWFDAWQSVKAILDKAWKRPKLLDDRAVILAYKGLGSQMIEFSDRTYGMHVECWHC